MVTQQPVAHRIEATSDSLESYSLLIVDDDETILSLLCDIPAPQDQYRIVTATDPRSALELLRVESFDLLITDYRMPEMTGLDLIREARQMHADLSAILITGFAWSDVASQVAEVGVYDLMLKPLNLGEVRLTIRNACERIRLIREIRRYQCEPGQTIREDAPIEQRMESAKPMTEFGLFPPNLVPVAKGSQKGERALDHLERLGKLYQMGLLTKEEFALSKNRLFGRA